MSFFAADFAQASVCDFNVIQTQRTDASYIFNICKREAQAGNAEAQFNLGFMYFSGIGVKQNFKDAAKWVRKSAERGYAQAQDSLGVMYSQGRGVQQSYAEGAKWFRKAAQQGLAGAQYNLGTMYTQGRGVRKISTCAVDRQTKSAFPKKILLSSYLAKRFHTFHHDHIPYVFNRTC